MKGALGFCFLMVVVASAGCVSQTAPSPAWSNWAEREGGVAQGPECARASTALARLGDPGWITKLRFLHVRVLNTNCPCAYAWPDGSLFVTKGLLLLLDDDELTGALAHEIGHLAEDSPRFKSAAFSGSGGTKCEVYADAAGCELLKSAGLAPDFLARALIKVRNDPRTPASLRVALSQRIQIIQGGEAFPEQTVWHAPRIR